MRHQKILKKVFTGWGPNSDDTRNHDCEEEGNHSQREGYGGARPLRGTKERPIGSRWRGVPNGVCDGGPPPGLLGVNRIGRGNATHLGRGMSVLQKNH